MPVQLHQHQILAVAVAAGLVLLELTEQQLLVVKVVPVCYQLLTVLAPITPVVVAVVGKYQMVLMLEMGV